MGPDGLETIMHTNTLPDGINRRRIIDNRIPRDDRAIISDSVSEHKFKMCTQVFSFFGFRHKNFYFIIQKTARTTAMTARK